MKIGLTLWTESNQRYASDAWNNNIGKKIPVRLDSHTVNGTLVSAVVADDGCSVELTLDIDIETLDVDGPIYKLVKSLYNEGYLET